MFDVHIFSLLSSCRASVFLAWAFPYIHSFVVCIMFRTQSIKVISFSSYIDVQRARAVLQNINCVKIHPPCA